MDRSDFIMKAKLKSGGEFITCPAPGIGDNQSGGIEVVVSKNSV